MTAPLLDPESVRMVLDSAYVQLQRLIPRAGNEPAHGAWENFDKLAAAVAWEWYPDELPEK